jgi:hypothetical protein
MRATIGVTYKYWFDDLVEIYGSTGLSSTSGCPNQPYKHKHWSGFRGVNAL